MKVLVVNCGSSSLKYQVLDMTGEVVLAKGLIERIGLKGSVIKHEKEGFDKVVKEVPMKDHKDAIKQMLEAILDPETGVLKDMAEIGAVGQAHYIEDAAEPAFALFRSDALDEHAEFHILPDRKPRQRGGLLEDERQVVLFGVGLLAIDQYLPFRGRNEL